MVFSSLLFLCLFLPAVLLGYFALQAIPEKKPFTGQTKNRICNLWLLLASLFFYAWGEPKYLFLMAATALVDYGAGLLLERMGKRGNMPENSVKSALVRTGDASPTGDAHGKSRGAKVVLGVTVVLNLGSLCFFKYAGFLADNLLRVLGVFGFTPGNTAPFDFLGSVVLPIGISFYTFQTLSYVIDVYRGTVRARRNFLDFFTYVSLFPQLIAGPIVRYTDVEKELTERRFLPSQAANGICRFCVGLAKKVLLANSAGALYETLTADKTAAGGFTAVMAWTASLAYFFQIYFDFAGYSDMAIGMGEIFGFHFPENFRYPYEASSVTDFWRRWHITLSSWFREYLYIPLGGNRRGKGRQIFNLFVVWTLTGLWHGAGWNFLLWGGYFFLLLLLEKLFLLKYLEGKGRLRGILRHIYALFCIFFGWVLFAGSPGEMLPALAGIGLPLCSPQSVYYLLTSLPLLLLCGVASTHYPTALLRRIDGRLTVTRRASSGELSEEAAAPSVLRGALCLGLLLLSLALLVGDSYNPFLYFRF